jgi:hypothetical protein
MALTVVDKNSQKSVPNNTSYEVSTERTFFSNSENEYLALGEMCQLLVLRGTRQRKKFVGLATGGKVRTSAGVRKR